MSQFARLLSAVLAAALTFAVAYGGGADDVGQRLKALEDENKELKKQLEKLTVQVQPLQAKAEQLDKQIAESAELRKQVEKLSGQARLLQAKVDELEIALRQVERLLTFAKKDLESRLVDMVQQELQGRRARVGPMPPEQGRFDERPYMGFDGQDIDADASRVLNLKGKSGVLVTDVREGGPAGAAGLKRNDVIVAFDGAEIRTFQDFKQAVSARKGGGVVTLAVLRGEEKLEVKVTLGVRRVRLD